MSDLIPIPPVLDRLMAGTATPEEFVTSANLIAAMAARLAEVKRQYEEAAIEWLNANGGSLECGEIRWYTGVDKVTKCVDQRETLGALLRAADGDLDSLAGCLAAGAFKPGAARQVLDTDYDRYFTTTEKPDLKTGKPSKRLKQMNTAYGG